jgi:hypothetical protein
MIVRSTWHDTKMPSHDPHGRDAASGATTRSDDDHAYAACKADTAGCDRDAVNQLTATIDDAKLPLADR